MLWCRNDGVRPSHRLCGFPAPHRSTFSPTPQRESLASVRDFLNHSWRLQVKYIRFYTEKKSDKWHQSGFVWHAVPLKMQITMRYKKREGKSSPSQRTPHLHNLALVLALTDPKPHTVTLVYMKLFLDQPKFVLSEITKQLKKSYMQPSGHEDCPVILH